jgi:hypothetical protein
MNKRALRGRNLLMALGMVLCVGSAWCAPQDSQPEGAVVTPPTAEENNEPPLPPASDFSRTPKEKVFSVAVLRAYVQYRDETDKTQLAKATNRFCFVQQRSEADDSSGPSYRMIWLEGKRLIHDVSRWPEDDADDQLLDIRFSKSIDMEKDVRSTYKEIYGSTFLVHRAWLDWIVLQCKRSGRWVTVPPVKKRAP